MKKYLLVIIIVIAVILTSCGQTKSSVPNIGNVHGVIDESIELQIDQVVEESGAPSMAVGIVVNEEILWAKGYGLQPDLSTVYSVGSIEKSFLATAVLQLVEQELIHLEDDVNQFLPFSVRHPNYPDTPITIRMLLSHKSGLPHDLPGTRYLDNDGPMLRWLFSNKGRQIPDLYRSYFPMDKDEYLEEVFSVDSKYGSDFWIFAPGSGNNFQYSNSAFSLLLAEVIREVTGQSYQDYIQDHILDPLEMTNTSFEASDFPEEQIAVPYENFDAQGYSDLPLTGMTASGKLRSTVQDLSKFLLIHMNHGELGDIRILQPESIDMMHERVIQTSGTDFPSLDFYGMGYGWLLWGDGYQGHTGGTPGYFSQMIYRENDLGPYGVILMVTNGCSMTECDFEWFDTYFVAIREILLEEAEELNNQDGPSK